MLRGLEKITYYYLDTGRHTAKASFFILITTFSILYFFEPFGDIQHGNTFDGILRIGSYALLTALLFYLLEQYVKNHFLRLFTSRLLIVLWYALLLSIISLGVFVLKNYWTDFRHFSFSGFGTVVYRVVSIGILVLLIVGSLFSYTDNASDEVVLKSTDLNPDYLKVLSSVICLLESEKNYTTVYYSVEGSLKKKIMRGSLNYFQSQLPASFIRTHRSYIVNLLAIESVSGNSQGLT
ncbi:MAG: LytTR family DNA-binding domain-containing protein, partial [Bacteroidota bacterium]